MIGPRTQKTRRTHERHGVVLRTFTVGEQDVFVTFFTREEGKLSCLAKGLKNIKSRRATQVELMSWLSVHYWKSRHQNYLTQAVIQHRFDTLKQEWDSLASGTFLIETVERLCGEGEPHPEVFDLLLESLLWMDRMPEQHHRLREFFLLKLLANLGVMSSFRTCAACQDPLPTETAYFDPNHLTLHCLPCEQKRPAHAPLNEPIALEHLKLLHFIHKQSVEELLKLKLEPAHQDMVWTMGRRFLRHTHPHPLRSEAFLTSALQRS